MVGLKYYNVIGLDQHRIKATKGDCLCETASFCGLNRLQPFLTAC